MAFLEERVKRSSTVSEACPKDTGNRLFWEYFDTAVGKHPDNPKAQLLAVFEWIDELLIKPECYGCPFLITKLSRI